MTFFLDCDTAQISLKVNTFLFYLKYLIFIVKISPLKFDKRNPTTKWDALTRRCSCKKTVLKSSFEIYKKSNWNEVLFQNIQLHLKRDSTLNTLEHLRTLLKTPVKG